MAARLGRPFLPWQQAAADVMGEVLPSGRMAYPLVIAVVPRRAGKTVLTLATSYQRATIGQRRRVWYTAQTGGDAGDTFVNEWLPLVDGSPLAKRTRKRLSNGSQALALPALGSRIGIFPPTRSGLHGKDADMVTVDEAWAFSDDAGRTLEAGIRPAMATRPARQLVVISAAGDADSTWLLRLRDMGRDLVERGDCDDAGVCFIEFSPPHVRDGDGWKLDPAVDLDDPELWARTHPAVGHTIDLDFLRTERRTTDLPAFARAYLGVFSSTTELPSAVPMTEWAAAADATAGVTGQVRIAYDTAADASWSAVAVASRRPDGRVVAELADYRPGDSWLPDRLMAMHKAHRGTLSVIAGGPADATTAELRRRGLDVTELRGKDATTACAELLSDVRAGRLVHRGQAALTTAAAGAAKAERGDGWTFTRKRSSGDVSPLVAVTAATAAARQTRSTGLLYVSDD